MIACRIIILLIFTLFITGCWEENYFAIDVPDVNPSIALPLVDFETTMAELIDQNASENTQIVIDSLGQITIKYQGEIIQQTAAQIFPPIPWLSNFPIADTVGTLPLPVTDEFNISRAIFQSTNVRFNFRSELEENIMIHLTMPEIFINGEVFERTFQMNYEGGSSTTFESDLISWDGAELITENNIITVEYDARDMSGNRIVMDQASMYMDIIAFSYVEGVFGQRQFDLDGSAVEIGIFNPWISGGFEFADPKVSLVVENSFGFEVSTLFNNLEIITLSGLDLSIQSSILESPVTFDYPTINEVGESKYTELNFNNANSNIANVFNEKAVRLVYDIDVLTNPSNDTTSIGFFSEDSFFKIDAAVEVPLNAQVNDLILSDTFDISTQGLEEFNKAKLFLNIKNNMPIDIDCQLKFGKRNHDWSYFNRLEDEWIAIKGSESPDIDLNDADEQTFGFDISAEDWRAIANSNSVAVLTRFNSTNTTEPFIWIKGQQGLSVEIGAVLFSE